MNNNLCPDAIKFAQELQEEVPEAIYWLNSLEKRKAGRKRSSTVRVKVKSFIR